MRQGIVLLIALFGIIPAGMADIMNQVSFTPPASDLSLNYLGLVFGNVGSALATANPNDLIAQIFKVFNIGVLVMTMSIIGYTVFTTVVGVSQEGSGAFQTKISPWVTFRIVAGSSMLLPSFGGYSGIQILVMTAVVKGVGFADKLWETTVNYVEQTGQSVMSAAKFSEASSHLSNASAKSQMNAVGGEMAYAIGAGVCVASYQSQASGSETSFLNPSDYGKIKPDGNKYHIMAGDKICATITVPNNLEGAAKEALISTIGTLVENGKQYYKSINQPDNLENSGNDIGCYQAKASIAGCGVSSLVSSAAVVYPSIVLASGVKSEDTEVSESFWATEAKRRGWITAAMYYNKLLKPEKNAAVSCQLGSTAPRCDQLFTEFKIDVFSPTGAALSSGFENAAGKKYSKITNLGTIVSGSFDAAFAVPPVSGDASGQYSKLMTKIETAIEDGIGVGVKGKYSKPIPTSSTQLAGGDDEAYFAFDHMLVMTNTVVSKLTGCAVYKCSSPAGNYDAMGCMKLAKNDDSLCKSSWSNYKSKSDSNQKSGFLKMLADEEVGRAINPLWEMRSLGNAMIKAAVNYWQTTLHTMYSKSIALAWKGFGIKTTINAAASGAMVALYSAIPAAVAVSAAQSIAIGLVDIFMQFAKMAMEVYVPFGTALATVFFGLGVVLGIYLPFMPYLLYVFGAIGWLIGVAESMVAAPLVAMGITHPEGHDLLGKAEQSLMLLLGIFIRPATMLIGFIFAINLASIAVGLLNRGFMSVMIDYISGVGGTALVSTIGIVGTMLVYTYVMMAVLDQAYSLIYQIPDRILRWIGGPADAPGAGAAQAAREVKSQTQSAGQQAGQGAGQAMSAPNIQSDSQSGSFDGKSIGEQKDSQKQGGGSASSGGGG